jgi:hypothetical protein
MDQIGPCGSNIPQCHRPVDHDQSAEGPIMSTDDDAEPMVSITVTVPEALQGRVQRLAKRCRTTFAEVARDALSAHASRFEFQVWAAKNAVPYEPKE